MQISQRYLSFFFSLESPYFNLSLMLFWGSTLILLSNFHYLISALSIFSFQEAPEGAYILKAIHYHANNPIIACFTTIIVVSLIDVIHRLTQVNRHVHPDTQICSQRCNDVDHPGRTMKMSAR